jgi:hypothetical protein
MRDAGAAEDAWVAALNLVLDDLARRHEQEPDKALEEHIRETLRSSGFLDPVHDYHESNPMIPVIVVKPWHGENDIRNAFRMIRERQKERPSRGRPKRDPLQSVQCAIFADRYGWTEDRVSQYYGWESYGKAGKYIREGRRILNAP